MNLFCKIFLDNRFNIIVAYLEYSLIIQNHHDFICFQQNQYLQISVYAILSEETSKEVFINVHAGGDIKELNAEVKFKDDKINQKCDKIPFPSSVEDRGQRNVFTCFLTGLQSYTLYDIDLIYQNKVLNSTKYRTIAEQYSNDDLVILFGGDWGYQTNGLKIVEQISKVNPDVILIG